MALRGINLWHMLFTVLTAASIDITSRGIDVFTDHELAAAIDREVSTRYGDEHVTADDRTTQDIIFSALAPKSLATGLILAATLYVAHIWLESILPTHRRKIKSQMDRQAIDKVTDSNPALEDEVLERLVSKGKVKGTSVNWCNTIMKWLLVNLLTTCVYTIINPPITQYEPGRPASKPFFLNMAYALVTTITNLWSISALAVFISLLAVPDRIRVLCTAAVTLVSSSFVAIFVFQHLHWYFKTGPGEISLAFLLNGRNFTSAGHSTTSTVLQATPVAGLDI